MGDKRVGALQRLREHAKKRMADRNDERPDLSVAAVYPDAVPVRGSVHIANGMIVSRKTANALFRKLRFG